MALERTCKRCGKYFDPKVEWQKFCEPECQKLYWRELFQDKATVNKRIEKLEEQLKASQEQTNKDKEVTGEEVKT